MVDNKFRPIGPQSKPFKEPESDVELHSDFTETQRRIERSHTIFNIDWFPSSYAEKYEFLQRDRNRMFMRDHQPSTEVQCISIKKVLLKGDQFENEKSEIVKGVREALTYTLFSNVYESEAFKMGAKEHMTDADGNPQVGSFATYKVGLYRYPSVAPVFDRSVYPPRKVRNDIKGYSWRFWIPSTKEEILSVIKRYGEPLKGYSCSISNTGGASNPYEGNCSYSVFSKDDFLNCSAEELIAINQSGLVKKGDPTSKVDEYRRRQKRKAQLKKQGAEDIMPIDSDNVAFLKQNNLDLNQLVLQLKLNAAVANEQPIKTQSKQKTKR